MNVVWSNPTDTVRIAEIDGKFYPYMWSLEQAQVYPIIHGASYDFANHSEAGIKCVSRPYDTLTQAKRATYRK